MSTIDEIGIELSINVNETSYSELRKLESILYRTMGLLKKFSGSEELDKAVAQVQRLIAVVRAAQIAYHALQMARMAAGDPLAWASFAVSAVSATVMAGEYVYDSTRGY